MNEISLKNVKGTFDYGPKEQLLRNYVVDTLKNVFERYGYQPIETPTICYYDVLASKYSGGAEILKEVYQLSDQGKRELALRYDLTVPFAKFIAMSKDLSLPFKRYEIGKVFRDGPVKVGRNREFTQCDVDVVGVSSFLADAELISLYVTAFDELQIPFCVSYNNRKLMSGLLKACGILDAQITDTILIIDKIKKKSKKEIVDEFLSIGLTDEQIDALYVIFSKSFEEILEMKADGNELLQQGIEELLEVRDALKEMGIEEKTSIDLTLARGLTIYTGTVFEVFATRGHMTSAIGGGGRYNQIITNFLHDGNEYPAVGCSFGLDAICEVLKEMEQEKQMSFLDLYMIPLSTEKECLRLAYQLRKENVRLDIQMTHRKLNKILNMVDRMGIPYVMIVGMDEINQKKVVIKSMKEKESKEFMMDDVASMAAYLRR